MIRNLMYVELKSGYGDDGPAWIGYVKSSRSGRTVYFNDHALQRVQGISGNFADVETGKEYWVSGVKKRGTNRHPSGSGIIMIDRRAVAEYLALTGEAELSSRDFEVVDIADCYPVDRVHNLLNEKWS